MTNVKTETIRLDRALERVMVGDVPPADAAQARYFEDMIDGSHHPPGFGLRPDGLSEQVFEAIMPRLRDGRILRSSRYLLVLQELAALLAPAEERKDRVKRVGAAIVRGEIRRHLLLRHYLNSLVES